MMFLSGLLHSCFSILATLLQVETLLLFKDGLSEVCWGRVCSSSVVVKNPEGKNHFGDQLGASSMAVLTPVLRS